MRHRNFRPLTTQRLDRKLFAPFGEVIQTEGCLNYPINNGMAVRYHGLATVETTGPNAHGLINLFRAKPSDFPVKIGMMERHPLGSQAFIAMHDLPWLVVVAHDNGGKPGEPLAFRVDRASTGIIGVNYATDVWHHPLLALHQECEFIVIDRGGEGNNLEEFAYEEAYSIASL